MVETIDGSNSTATPTGMNGEVRIEVRTWSVPSTTIRAVAVRRSYMRLGMPMSTPSKALYVGESEEIVDVDAAVLFDRDVDPLLGQRERGVEPPGPFLRDPGDGERRHMANRIATRQDGDDRPAPHHFGASSNA